MKHTIIDVFRPIQELDVVLYCGQVHACTRVSDCSAKLVPLSDDFEKAEIDAFAEGFRISPTSTVGDTRGAQAFRGDSYGIWLIGKLNPEQVIRHDSGPTGYSRVRKILEVVTMPLPGQALKAKKPKAKEEVAPTQAEPPRFSEAAKAPVLAILASSARLFAASVSQGIQPEDP